jgi:hypothetical protein
MVILRPTKKLRSLLPVAEVSTRSDTALGDWYVNRLVVQRQPLLLLVSSASLLPLVVPARDVRSLPSRLESLVALRLGRFGLDRKIVEAELRAMRPVVVAPTEDRSVLGSMVDFAKAASYYSEELRADWGLEWLEDWLAQTPCRSSLARDRVVFPNQRAPDLLQARWLASRPL